MPVKRIKILLDIDDTALLTSDRGKTWYEHPRLHELIKDHDIYLFSGNPDISNYYSKWKTKGYIPKWGMNSPKAEILIDNNADLHITECEVKFSYTSIDEFYKNHFKKNRVTSGGYLSRLNSKPFVYF